MMESKPRDREQLTTVRATGTSKEAPQLLCTYTSAVEDGNVNLAIFVSSLLFLNGVDLVSPTVASNRTRNVKVPGLLKHSTSQDDADLSAHATPAEHEEPQSVVSVLAGTEHVCAWASDATTLAAIAARTARRMAVIDGPPSRERGGEKRTEWKTPESLEALAAAHSEHIAERIRVR